LCPFPAFARSPRARLEYQPTWRTKVLVAIGNVAAQQLQPLGAGHDLEVALQAQVHVRAVDHRSRLRVIGHLLKRHRRAQHVSGELASTLGIALAYPHLVVRRKSRCGASRAACSAVTFGGADIRLKLSRLFTLGRDASDLLARLLHNSLITQGRLSSERFVLREA